MRSELRRLRTIARALNCCPRHGARLQCGPCDWTWTGADAQFEELRPLADRIGPYFEQIGSHGTCRCGSGRWCHACYAEAAANIEVPDNLFTAQERERYFELSGLMVPKKSIGTVSHAGRLGD
jgi:hypothetical protein